MESRCLTKENSFPLTLNLWDVKHLTYFLGGYSEDVIGHFIRSKSKNVSKKELTQIKNGKQKVRTIYNQRNGYKKLLRAINKEISRRACFPKGILGGIKGKTIDDMAKRHCGQEGYFVMDIKDFFPNIDTAKVFAFFKKAKCSDEVAGILTELVTFEDHLPQGFPTSTTMANLIAYGLDVEHLRIAKKYNLVRTRWIDDIVFSGRIKAIKDATREIIGAVMPTGFKISHKKTGIRLRNAKKEKAKPVVVGFEVNHKSPHIPSKKIGEVEQILENCQTKGYLEAMRIYNYEKGKNIKNFRCSLIGVINFIKKYDSQIGIVLEKKLNTNLTGTVC